MMVVEQKMRAESLCLDPPNSVPPLKAIAWMTYLLPQDHNSLIPPKQFHQLGPNYSNLCTYGGPSNSNHLTFKTFPKAKMRLWVLLIFF